ncbi:hypothetical protein PFISCL1PPCAC_20742 [Pristionchus fissidentatus]|uniref:G protein-coupled receptor n=1 Tax=Pristionchus fissidentatus TaxID=1538716 RepID=A0AAV5WG36_9BILA|nr:hypothetical protein PFISCL1PPCAC_20742 [Pristionchus fissidentatus]
MSFNASLRYGFKLERAFFLDFSMSYMFYMPLITALTFHPIIQYLLIFQNKSMRREIRIGYIFTHLILDEWSFCFLFRIYPLIPIAALYCEGPLCTAGLDKQVLMSLLAIPVILINPPFIFLVARMHQMFVPLGGNWRMSIRLQCMLYVILNLLLIANVVGFGYFGRDHDRSAQIMEPELAWLKSRGGTIFLYGPPGDPQYFKWGEYVYPSAILIIAPTLIFLNADAMNNIRISSAVSSKQHHFLNLLHFLFFISFIDRFLSHFWTNCHLARAFLSSNGINDHQFCIFFIFKNQTNRKVWEFTFELLIPMCTNRSLRYGFEWDRDYFIDFYMKSAKL